MHRVLALTLTLSACTSGPSTPTDTDDTDTDDTDTDAPDPCEMPASAGPIDVTDLGEVETSCFLATAFTYPEVFDTEADLAAVYVCDDGWPLDFDWATQRLVLGAPTSCGTNFRDAGVHPSGEIEVLLYGRGCGAPRELLHAVGLPDGAAPVTLTICEQDDTPYP